MDYSERERPSALVRCGYCGEIVKIDPNAKYHGGCMSPSDCALVRRHLEVRDVRVAGRDGPG